MGPHDMPTCFLGTDNFKWFLNELTCCADVYGSLSIPHVFQVKCIARDMHSNHYT